MGDPKYDEAKVPLWNLDLSGLLEAFGIKRLPPPPDIDFNEMFKADRERAEAEFKKIQSGEHRSKSDTLRGRKPKIKGKF